MSKNLCKSPFTLERTFSLMQILVVLLGLMYLPLPVQAGTNDPWWKRVFYEANLSITGGGTYNAYTHVIKQPISVVDNKFYLAKTAKDSEIISTYYLLQWPHDAPAEVIAMVDDHRLEGGLLKTEDPNPADKKILGMAAPAAGALKAGGGSFQLNSQGFSIPLTTTLFWEIGNKFRLGGGFGIIFSRFYPTDLQYISSDNEKKPLEEKYTPDENFLLTFDPFILVGYKFLQRPTYGLALDLKGGMTMDNLDFRTKRAANRNIHYNLILSYEHFISDHLKGVIGGYWENDSSYGTSMEHCCVHTKWGLCLGINMQIPKLSKCRIKPCSTHPNHSHSSRQFRSRIGG